jgi:hypothetical protein
MRQPPTSHIHAFLIALLLGLCVLLFLHMNAAARSRPTRETFVSAERDPNTHHIYNEYHLGDAVFTMMYLNNVAAHLEKNDIRVNFYINPAYIGQVSEFVPNSNVKVLPLDRRPANAYNIWAGKQFDTYSSNRGNRFKQFNDFIVYTQNMFAKRAGLPTMDSFQYTDERLLERYEELDNRCKNVDILIINAEPKSGQYAYNKGEWDAAVRELAAKYKVVTTSKVDGIPCTADFKYSLKDIAAVSTHAHYIIAVNSGPLVGCFNTDTLRHTKKWFVFDNINHYNLPNITHLNSLEELAEYFP